MLEGDAWQHLKSLSSVLTAISLSVGVAVEGNDGQLSAEAEANKHVADALDSLAKAFHERFRGFNSNGVVYGAASTQYKRQTNRAQAARGR